MKFWILLLGAAPHAGVQQPAPLAVSDLLEMRRFEHSAPLTVSPDDRWASYTLVSSRKLEQQYQSQVDYTASGVPNRARGTELWVVNLDTRQTIDLSAKHGSTWGGTWSPNGRYLAYYTDRSGALQIWVWDSRNRKARSVSPAQARPSVPPDLPQWTPDGKSLVVKLLSETREPSDADSSRLAASLGVRVFASGPTTGIDSGVGAGLAGKLVADLAVIDVATGRARRLMRSVAIGLPHVASDGDRVAIALSHGFRGTTQEHRTDILAVNLRDGSVQTLARNVPQGLAGMSLSWSPDGQFLAYARTGSDSVASGWFVVPRAGGAARRLAPGHPHSSEWYRGPLWQADGKALYFVDRDTLWRTTLSEPTAVPAAHLPHRKLASIIGARSASGGSHIVWSPDSGRTLLLRTLDSESRAGMAAVDLLTGATRQLYENEELGHISDFDVFSIGTGRETVVYIRETADTPPDLCAIDVRTGTQRRVTHVNPGLDKYVFGKSQVIRWLTLDGNEVKGVLLLPSDYTTGRRYPMVVVPYGSNPLSKYANAFGLGPASDYFNAHLFTTRGYAVLAPDAPQTDVSPMLDLAKTILPGVNKAIELGVADARRLGVAGGSYGGYTALALITQTRRFRAAISIAGIGNLLTMYGQVDDSRFHLGVGWAEGAQGRMRASPWERRDRYIENSPFFYLDRIHTPLLLIHGSQDQAAPVFASDEIYTGLVRLGRTVAYAKYEGVDHDPTRARMTQVSDYYFRILEWLGTYLAPDSPGVPSATTSP